MESGQMDMDRDEMSKCRNVEDLGQRHGGERKGLGVRSVGLTMRRRLAVEMRSDKAR